MPSNEPTRGAAQDRFPDALQISPCRHQVADFRGEYLALLALLEIGDDLADAEYAHRHHDEADAVGQLGHAEGEAQHAGVDVGADQPEQQADHHHRRSP